jgi:hypothetical protein
MTKFKITPFLILCPLVIAYSIFVIVTIEGFATIMISLYFWCVGIAVVALIVDRLLFKYLHFLILWVTEILLTMGAYRFADTY